MKRFLATLLIGVSFSATAALKIEVREEERTTHLIFDLGYARLSNQDKDKITALTGRLSIVYGVHRLLGLEADLEQAFSPTDGFSAVYSRLSVGPSFALLGSMRDTRSQVWLGGNQVMSSSEAGAGRLRLNASAEQLFLNGSARLLGLAGFGVGLLYDFPVTPDFAAIASVRWARLSNSNLTLTPIQFGLGLVF